MDNFSKEEDMEKVFGDLQKLTMMNMKEIILKIVRMVQDNIDGLMEQFLMEHLKMIWNMGEE